jgi:hypothetical protein
VTSTTYITVSLTISARSLATTLQAGELIVPVIGD